MQKGFFETRHHYIKLSGISDIIEKLTTGSESRTLKLISYNNLILENYECYIKAPRLTRSIYQGDDYAPLCGINTLSHYHSKHYHQKCNNGLVRAISADRNKLTLDVSKPDGYDVLKQVEQFNG
jgi:hypothetical protein